LLEAVDALDHCEPGLLCDLLCDRAVRYVLSREPHERQVVVVE
jgi:hypothetical protein